MILIFVILCFPSLFTRNAASSKNLFLFYQSILCYLELRAILKLVIISNDKLKQIMTRVADEKLKIIEHYSYNTGESIGKGFSSTVYKGKNNQNGTTVAIKVIDLHKLSETTMHELLKS